MAHNPIEIIFTFVDQISGYIYLLEVNFLHQGGSSLTRMVLLKATQEMLVVEGYFEMSKENGFRDFLIIQAIARLSLLNYGVVLAWNSQTTITCLQKGDIQNRNNRLISKIIKLTLLPWEVVFRHTLREGNICTDWIVNRSLSKEYGLEAVVSPPSELSQYILGDVSGASIPRIAHVYIVFFRALAPSW